MTGALTVCAVRAYQLDNVDLGDYISSKQLNVPSFLHVELMVIGINSPRQSRH